MHQADANGTAPYRTELTTPRLIIRLADPNSASDADKIIRTYNDDYIGPWGLNKVGIHTHADVIAKNAVHGPKPRHCTKLPKGVKPPASMIHLVYLKPSHSDSKAGLQDSAVGDYIGFVGLSFRSEMPWPDLGYGFFEQFNGLGYASEAGREVLKWWREEIGVLETFVGTFDENVRSQNCARRIGYVEAGVFSILFGDGGVKKGRAFIQKGMKWPDGEMKIRAHVPSVVEDVA